MVKKTQDLFIAFFLMIHYGNVQQVLRREEGIMLWVNKAAWMH